jgi:hypothetical protein
MIGPDRMKSLLALILIFTLNFLTNRAEAPSQEAGSPLPSTTDFQAWLDQYNAQNPSFQLTIGPDGLLAQKAFSQGQAGSLLPPDFLSQLPTGQLETVAYPRSSFPDGVPFVPPLIAGDLLVVKNPKGPLDSLQDLAPSASVVPEPSSIAILVTALTVMFLKRRCRN